MLVPLQLLTISIKKKLNSSKPIKKIEPVTVEKLKQNLINRLMKIERVSTLEQIEYLIIQEEMQNRANESLEAFEKGEVSTIDEFATSNQEWLKKKSMK